MSYKLYSIIPSSPTGSISIVTEIMKISSSKYASELTPKEITRANNYYPNRIVTSSIVSSSFTGLGLFKLTDTEANRIINDPLISKVNILSTQSIEYLSQSSIPDRNYRFAQTSNDTSNINKFDLSSYANYYHSLPLNKAFSGSFGSKTFEMFGGDFNSSGMRTNIDSYTLIDNVDYSIDGKGVDIIILEGSQNGIELNHAEFYGRDGNSRVKLIDWRDYDDSGALDNWNHEGFWSTRIIDDFKPPHRQRVATSAAGLTSGFAKGSDIYFFPLFSQTISRWIEILQIFINFNQNKPINPKTGRRNRTVINWSFSSNNFRIYPHHNALAFRGRVSGSISPPTSLDTGLRIEAQNLFEEDIDGSQTPFISGVPLNERPIFNQGIKKDKIFILSSSMGIVKNITINNHTNTVDAYYYTGGLAQLSHTINSTLNPTNLPTGWTSSIEGTELNITSSLKEPTFNNDALDYNTLISSSRVGPLRIYTGSINEFVHEEGVTITPENSPRGGNLAFEGSPIAKTNISKIVLKGNEVYTGDNGKLNSNHSFFFNPVCDAYGVDRGHNSKSTYNYFNNSFYGGGYSSTMYPTFQQALKEVAEAGIINVMASGNDGQMYTMESSSIEDNSLYDPDLYSEDLGSTYIEFNREYNGILETGQFSPLEGGPIPPNTPFNIGLPHWQSNYSTIYAGGLDLNKWHVHHNRVEYKNTVVGGGTSSITGTQGRINADNFKNYGAAISVYAIAGGMTTAGSNPTIAGFPPVSGFREVATSSSFYTTINFNTSSLRSKYSEPYFTASFSESISSSLYSGDSRAQRPDVSFTQGIAFESDVGGTSFSSPLTVGVIACYLEVNPDASFIDVRNWLHSKNTSFLTHSNSPSDKFYHRGEYVTSSRHPAYYENTYFVSGGIDLGGRNGNILHFPYNSPLRGKLSNITMSRT